MQLAGNRSLEGCLSHCRAPSVGCLRCRRHETGPSTTFNPDPSTIPRILRKLQAVYLRFYFCPRRHGRGMSPKRSRWAGFVAGIPGATGVKPDRRAAGSAARPRGASRGLSRASRGPDALDARPHRPRGRWSPPSRPRGTPAPAPPESFSKIVLASPSEFPYSIFPHGGVAQLGERLTGSQEVRGSIPLVSTRALNEALTQVGAFFHIGTQGQRRHHDPPGRQDRALNGCRAHGIISHRGSRWVARFDGLYHIHYFTRALGATVSAGDS